MPTVAKLAVTLLIGLMVVVEIAEHHAVDIMIIGIGLSAWAIHARLGSHRRRLAVLSAMVALTAICLVGSTYWNDGLVDWLDALYALGAVVVGLGVVAALWGFLAPVPGDADPG
ncbi:MAG TPA: hypothetical protein HPQ04_00575 [Rhodospirillaceae bacterium]|nr:hypothetical protein [Rhodospirillaceae bacterium]